MLTTEQLVQCLRTALDHLYEPDRLRRSPLAALLSMAGRVDTSLLLRQALVEAIESLRPGANVQYRSPVWRVYEVLLYRYVQQFSQQEVADQLGLSVRQLRREQEAALEMLAAHVWTEFELGDKLVVRGDIDEASQPTIAVAPSVSEELAWLRDPSQSEPADLAREFTAAAQLVHALAAQHDVHLEIAIPDPLPKVAMHPTALRQAVLSLLTVAIHRTPRGKILISGMLARHAVQIEIRATSPRSGPRPTTKEETDSQDMALRLVSIFGGELSLPSSGGPFAATITLPALEQLSVLAIDDNEDTLRLLKRYTTGTRYHLVGTCDPEQALSLAEDILPRVIVLDVMMPGVDGWELLGRLRQHPLAEDIPVIACTVLAQEELALSLGASDLLRKPVTRQAFLEALDRQISTKATGSHRGLG